MVGIYQIRNIENDKKYIGQSADLLHRKQTHKYDLRNNKSHCRRLQSAYNQNPESFVFEILCECKEEELNDKEIEYIKKYNTTNEKYGYNLDNGGKGKGRISEETRKIMSYVKKGNTSMVGIKLSDEWKKNLSKAQPHKKRILCIETNIIYESFADASRRTGLQRTKIVSCCTGNRKSTGGFHWRYADG